MLKLRTDTQTTDVRAMTNTYLLVIDKACHVFLEAGSEWEVLISWLLELVIQVTVLWRGRRREGRREEEREREEWWRRKVKK